MPTLEPVHVMEMDRSTSRLEHTHTNPTRVYALAGDRGSAFYTWQNGNWFDTGWNALDAADVPAECVADMDARPIEAKIVGPTVTAVCKFCGIKLNQSAMNQHYIEHVEQTLEQAGAVTDAVPPPALEPEPRRRRAEG